MVEAPSPVLPKHPVEVLPHHPMPRRHGGNALNRFILPHPQLHPIVSVQLQGEWGMRLVDLEESKEEVGSEMEKQATWVERIWEMRIQWLDRKSKADEKAIGNGNEEMDELYGSRRHRR